MDKAMVKKIQSNPSYIELVSKRSSYAWKLTIIMLVVYYTYIMVLAFSPDTLGQSLSGGVTTVGIPIGIAIIIFSFAITGVYVRRANSEFDDLLNKVKDDIAKDIK